MKPSLHGGSRRNTASQPNWTELIYSCSSVHIHHARGIYGHVARRVKPSTITWITVKCAQYPSSKPFKLAVQKYNLLYSTPLNITLHLPRADCTNRTHQVTVMWNWHNSHRRCDFMPHAAQELSGTFISNCIIPSSYQNKWMIHVIPLMLPTGYKIILLFFVFVQFLLVEKFGHIWHLYKYMWNVCI